MLLYEIDLASICVQRKKYFKKYNSMAIPALGMECNSILFKTKKVSIRKIPVKTM